MKLLNKCPICGGELFLDELYQYSMYSKILKSGKISKQSKKGDSGPLEAACIACVNNDFRTNYDDMVTVCVPQYPRIKVEIIEGKFYYEIEDEDD